MGGHKKDLVDGVFIPFNFFSLLLGIHGSWTM